MIQFLFRHTHILDHHLNLRHSTTTTAAIAVTSAARAANLPEVPTLREAGLADFDVTSWNALVAPAKTPPEVIARINTELNAVLADAAIRKQLLDAGVEALTIVNAAQGADKALIESVRVFDQFAGEKAEAQMGAGRKSVAITARLQPRDRTLTDKEIEAVAAKIVEKVARATGGTLRS